MDVELLVDDEVIVADHCSTDGAHEHTVTGQKRQQTGCVPDDLPGVGDDAEDRDDQRGAEDVDVLGAQTRDCHEVSFQCHNENVSLRPTIVGEWICSSSDLVANRRQHEAESGEELGSTGVELGNDSRLLGR